MLNSSLYRSSLGKIRLYNEQIQIYGIRRNHGFSTSKSTSSSSEDDVAVFWDLDNRPPKSYPLFDAAIRLKKVAQSFGFVRYMIGYANSHSLSYVPPSVKSQREAKKAMNKLETCGFIKSKEPYLCRVCGRRFYNNEKMINHFKQIHEREHAKRMNQIESAKGSRRLNLVGKYAMKMEKYRNAARDILIPRVEYDLEDEINRAGFLVRTVPDKPHAADSALRRHVLNMMERRMIECFVIVSDDADYVGILKEARNRCLKIVVVGDLNDGALKRVADACFSWQEIMTGKAKKEAISVLSKWKDQSVLKRLEWNYDPDVGKKLYRHDIDFDRLELDIEPVFFSSENESVLKGEEKCDGPWWKLEPDQNVVLMKRGVSDDGLETDYMSRE